MVVCKMNDPLQVEALWSSIFIVWNCRCRFTAIVQFEVRSDLLAVAEKIGRLLRSDRIFITHNTLLRCFLLQLLL